MKNELWEDGDNIQQTKDQYPIILKIKISWKRKKHQLRSVQKAQIGM